MFRAQACVPPDERLASARERRRRSHRAGAPLDGPSPGAHPRVASLGAHPRSRAHGLRYGRRRGGPHPTVNYVVLGAEQVRVTLLDQRAYVAEVVRHDYASGLALVRIPEDHLSALPLRRTTDLVPGEEAFIVASVGEGGARVASGAISYIGPFDANWEYVLDRAIMTTA